MSTLRALRLSPLVFALPLLATLALPIAAQDAKQYRSVSRYRLKPERAGDFVLNIKEYISVMKKANPDRSFSMWSSLTGPMEYVLVTYHAKYAELDQQMADDAKMKDVAAQLASIGSRINACVDSGERYIDEVQTELSLPRPAEMPKVIRVMRTRVKPDQVAAYTNLIRTEVLPAMKQAGVSSYTVARVRLGRPSSEFTSVLPVANWAELDAPAAIIRGMGDAAYQKYLAKVTPLIIESEVNLYRHMPDLSYTAAR